jgi:hypothetical protein
VDLLTEYLAEIRARLNHGTWTHVARSLGVVFWRTYWRSTLANRTYD